MAKAKQSQATYKRRAASAEKAARAAQLYMQGYSLRAIGEKLGVSHEMARKYLAAHLRDIPAAARDELQRQTLEHYQTLMDAFNPAAMGGDAQAAGVILKAREALRRMFALDEPERRTIDIAGAGADGDAMRPIILFSNEANHRKLAELAARADEAEPPPRA